jgi:hypothetical protein
MVPPCTVTLFQPAETAGYAQHVTLPSARLRNVASDAEPCCARSDAAAFVASACAEAFETGPRRICLCKPYLTQIHSQRTSEPIWSHIDVYHAPTTRSEATTLRLRATSRSVETKLGAHKQQSNSTNQQPDQTDHRTCLHAGRRKLQRRLNFNFAAWQNWS